MSLYSILGTDDDVVVGDFLKRFYIENPDECARRSHARKLDEFFAGRGDDEMRIVIETMWKHQKNRDRRLQVLDAGLDKYDNVIARIAQEKATVYNKPPTRKVANDTNEVYQEFLKVLPQDAVMSAMDRILAIHEAGLLWYRVRLRPTGEREPVLEAMTPAQFWAINHPNDRTLLVGVIFDIRMPLAKPEDPSYRVWTDDETLVLNAKCEVMAGSRESWPLGRMPGVLCSIHEPGTRPTLLEATPSSDLLSAQKQVRLQDLNQTKESVSANRQAYVSGDTSNTAMGQAADSDGEIILGEGVTVTSLDRGVDPESFRDVASYAADTAGANHGVPPTVRSQKDASSGAEIEMRMLPIRALREKRIPTFRRIEARIAEVMSMVNDIRVQAGEDGEPVFVEGDLSEFAFKTEGWSIDFAEVQQPMTESERDAVYEKRKQLQLTDPYEEEMRRNPDVKTVEEARAILKKRIEHNTEFVTEQKDLMAASGALGAAQPKTPFEANRGDTKKGADLKALAKEVLDAAN